MRPAPADLLDLGIAPADLAAWEEMLPLSVRVLGANAFGDVFLADGTGAVHMLDVGAASIERIAPGEARFRQRLGADRDGRLLRPLVDRCRAAGKALSPGRCYGYVTMPFLGGAYEPSNVMVLGVAEWIDLAGYMHRQTRDLPAGAKVRIVVTD